MAAIYDNQKNGANKIIEAFENPNCCWVIAKAEMQSGKSNTYMMVGAELLRCGRVKKVVIISANTDVELKKQTQDTKLFWNAYFKHLLNNNTDQPSDEVVDFVFFAENKFSVIWGTELRTNRTQLTNTLIIWDESHYGQSENQMIDNWFQAQGVNPDGSGCANGNIVLSVSATPFSECIDIEKHVQTKQLVLLEPGDNYFGVKQMMDNQLIKEFHPEDLSDMLDRLTDSQRAADADINRRNAAIIRTSTNSNEFNKVKFLCHQKGIQCEEMNTNSDEKDINVLLSKDEDQPRVVLVKGMLRMGKRIERKDRLLWCLETASDPNHDTTLQGLLGRCCGYFEGDRTPCTEVYLSPKQVENLNEWGVNKAGKAMNVKMAANSSRKKKPEITGYATVPLKVFIKGWRTGRGKAYISDITNALIEKRGNDKTTDRAWTILTSGVKSKIKFSNLEEKTYKNFGDILEKCCRNNTPLVTTQTSCGCNLDEVRVWYTGDECGKTVYLQYKTDIKPDKDDSPMSVGNTTGREIFAHKHEDGTEYQQNGSAHYKIGPETADNVGAMNSAIEDIFVWGRELRSDHVTAGNEITSDCNGHSFTGILVNAEVHAALKPGGSIYEHMKTNHGVLLKLVPSKGRPPKELPDGYTRLAAIRWE